MATSVLITGGAGFIGSHLADALIERGYRVRVLDSLEEQVHGPGAVFPEYLNPAAERVQGDVRSARDVDRALAGIDAVFHLAAAVGVGQSMYQIERYTDINNRGTAVVLEALLQRPVGKLVVASSMSVYGEGLYRTASGATAAPPPRGAGQLKSGRWELSDPRGGTLEPVATPEDKPAMPESVYALSKYDQERMCLLFGRAYGVSVTALRFFNVYGERQALANPYTGVLAIFAARYLAGKPPVIFEDGRQMRDFVHVSDLVEGCVLALERREARGTVLNLGSGRPRTVLEVAESLGRALGVRHLEPEISGQYRAGDVRHCFADIRRATSLIGYRPRVEFEQGLAALGRSLAGRAGEDRSELADRELRERGLVA